MSFALLRRAVLSALVLVSLLIALAIPAAPARAAGAGMIHGKVVDSVTLLPIQDVCVYLGIPGNFCLWKTAADGTFNIDLDAFLANDHGQWQNYFVKAGYVTAGTNVFTSNGGYVYGQDSLTPQAFPLVKQKVGPRSSCTDAGFADNPPALTSTVYLPNITRRLGGRNGFHTSFIIQNTGTVKTQLEVSFYKFTDGSCAERYVVLTVAPGTAPVLEYVALRVSVPKTKLPRTVSQPVSALRRHSVSSANIQETVFL